MASPLASRSLATVDEILGFWFGKPATTKAEIDICMKRWFAGGPDCDAVIEARYSDAMAAAARSELDDWSRTARGRLALILLLDQFPRSIHRGSHLAFAQDAAAIELVGTGIASGLDQTLVPLERMFFYMPLQHAESIEIQEQSVAVFTAFAESVTQPLLRKPIRDCAAYARQHRDIIAQFGRFPHRNEALGRENTPEEARYLAGGAPKFGQ